MSELPPRPSDLGGAASSPSSSTPSSPFGLLVIDKPFGWTSMDVCRNVRRRLVRGGAPKRVKVGHGGTLDPLATGVLVVLVGKATRLCDRVMAGEKGYRAQITLGATSETDDAEGPVTPTVCQRIPTRAEIDEVLISRFVGAIMQRPPAFSAMKVGGRRSYKLAREGNAPVLAERPVDIHAIDLVEFRPIDDPPAQGGQVAHVPQPRGLAAVLTLDVRCGKGTYIRSLARDLGEALGTGGYLSGLRRTRVGRFTIDRAVHPDSLPEAMTQTDVPEIDLAFDA